VLLLIKRDVKVLTASGDDLTEATDPSRIMMRQISDNRIGGAEHCLARYLAQAHRPQRHSRPAAGTQSRLNRVFAFFGDKWHSEINGALCRAYERIGIQPCRAVNWRIFDP
jgi:hypothetical protein